MFNILPIIWGIKECFPTCISFFQNCVGWPSPFFGHKNGSSALLKFFETIFGIRRKDWIRWAQNLSFNIFTSNVPFPKPPRMLVLLRRSFSYVLLGVFIWIHLNPRNFNPRYINFSVGFSFKTIFAPHRPITTLVSKDVEFSCAYFDLCKKLAGGCPPTRTTTQMFKNEFSIFPSQEIGSSLVSF